MTGMRLESCTGAAGVPKHSASLLSAYTLVWEQFCVRCLRTQTVAGEVLVVLPAAVAAVEMAGIQIVGRCSYIVSEGDCARNPQQPFSRSKGTMPSRSKEATRHSEDGLLNSWRSRVPSA